MAGAVGERSLQETPTWAVAAICAVFVVLSVLIEHGIHSLAKWFQKRQKKAMTEALEKIKSELMILGFISLLLTVGTKFIYKICIPASWGHAMLPCNEHIDKDNGDEDSNDQGHDNHDRRKLLSYTGKVMAQRVLAVATAGDDYCAKKDEVSLISQTGVHQLHIFIFVLAVFHVLYSVVTIALAMAKMKKWKAWEQETSSLEYKFTNDPARFRFTHQTSFVKRHSGFSRKPGIRWIVAFFRQFFGSVTKVDYWTMRNGFINAHFAPNSSFDFHKYIKRSMEDDFKKVVGVSIPLWFIAVIFLLLDVYKWNTLNWLTLAPILILLLVGTKMELVIMEMAQEIEDRTSVVRGVPVVEPNNKYFWFNRPHWILFLIHYTLFQNAFQMAFFLWTMYEFWNKDCFRENMVALLIRAAVGVVLQILCSYITFPLYALVTQMGSHMKRSIFEEQTAKALKKWQKAAKDRNKKKVNKRKAGLGMADHGNSASLSGFISGETTPSQASSPSHLLHNYNHRSNQMEIESVVNSPRSISYPSDTELSEIDDCPSTHQWRGQETIVIRENKASKNNKDENPDVNDFSFVKP